MKRLLCIVGSMDAGGAETFLMKVYRNMDRTKYQMDFCVAVKKPGFYDEEIRSLGGKILYTVPKSKGMLKSFMTICKIVKDNQYKYVLRVSQHSLSALELLAARLGGAKVLAFRSSNSKTIGGKVNCLLHEVCKPLANIVPNVKIAPSTEAAEFMFGKKCVKKGKTILLQNGLDTNVYKFSEEARENLRKELDVEDNFVIGHVGRFNFQKNHEFLIDVFAEVKKQKSNAVLVLIGKGELEERVKEKVKTLGLEDSVMLLGVRDNVSQLLSAMDIFVFPSLFEGMPNTVVEAQTNGLPCVVSTNITREVEITDLVCFKSLEEHPQKWAECIINIEKEQQSRSGYYMKLIEEGYDIKDSSYNFVKCIFERENK